MRTGRLWAEQDRPFGEITLGEAAVNDSIGGEAIVVFSSERGPAGAAFLPQAGGRSLTFEAANGAFRDREMGSEWNLDGRASPGR